jgi:hypothetical protein
MLLKSLNSRNIVSNNIILTGENPQITLPNYPVLPTDAVNKSYVDTYGSKNIIFVSIKSDLPTPINGVIYLEENLTYYITAHIDLTGDRIETSGPNVVILGSSSENCSLSSTGIPNGTPLITSRWTIILRFISINDVNTGIYIDDNSGLGSPLAIDWIGVNFLNVPNIGTIGNIDNFIYESGSFLGSKNLIFNGNVGTISFDTALLRGDGSAGNIIQLTSNANILRRFRIIYSSVVAFGSTIGLNVSSSATIPDEGYILDTVNFSGGGTYTTGLTYLDNKSIWKNCVGVTNSSAIGNMYIVNNPTSTSIAVQGNRYPLKGAANPSVYNQRFSLSLIDGVSILTYTNNIKRLFLITFGFTVLSGNNNVIGIYIGVNRTIGSSLDANNDRITESELYLTTNGTRPDSGFSQCITELNYGDRVYMIVQNTSSTNSITINFLNMMVQKTVE